MKYYEEFYHYFSTLDEVIKYCDQGIDVFETFETDLGEEFFVWNYTRQAYNSWLEYKS